MKANTNEEVEADAAFKVTKAKIKAYRDIKHRLDITIWKRILKEEKVIDVKTTKHASWIQPHEAGFGASQADF